MLPQARVQREIDYVGRNSALRLITGFTRLQGVVVLTVLLGSIIIGQQVPTTALHDLDFLLGEWIAEGGGGPGQGTGGFSFELDLQGRVLIRKNYAEYPATKDGPAHRHDDLMVIYKQPTSEQLRAVFFDNEGHAINYSIRSGDHGKLVEFLSDATASAPTYRLTYQSTGSDTLSLKFEIASAESPNSFRTYIVAKAHRQKVNSDSGPGKDSQATWQFDAGG